MESLKTMDKGEYVARMQEECRRIMGQVADAVNAAPTGNLISGSEMQVRDLMEELRQKAFELSVQMRIDSTESTFSPSAGRGGESPGEQGTLSPQHDDGQRPNQLVPPAVGGGKEGSVCPVDRLVDETEAAVSVGVRQLCCREATQARSFARGRENLKHAAQLQVGEELFRQIVESEGRAILKASECEQLELDWSAKQCVVQTPQGEATTRLYASSDGVLVPVTTQAEKDKRRLTVRKWRKQTPRKKRGKLKRLPAVKKASDQRYKQIYVSVLYDQSQAHRLVGVTRKGVMGLQRMLKRDGERVKLIEARERRGIIDGAVCLKSNLEVLPLQGITLDFYHFGEHVGQAGVATLGSQTPACKDWLDKTLHTARHEGYAPFFQQILEWRTPLRGGKRKAADALIGYVAPRQDMINYDQCEKNGWDVGSGPMESMCGVTTDRIKGRGRRWDIDNAEAIMEIEALYQSTGLWDRYWANAFNHRN